MRRLSKSASIGHLPDSDLEKNKKSQDDKDIPKEKKSNFIKEYLIDYTSNSNLHGLKYIGEKERTYIEKIFWVFAFICCVFLCANLIHKVWIKWNVNPVIVSFAENPTPVWQIPYPAITVCIETKAMQSKFNFTEYYHLYLHNDTYLNLTEQERNLFEDVTMVCDDHHAPSSGRKFSNGNETVANIIEVSPNLTEVILGCMWKDLLTQNCSDLFSPVVTEEGLCYTFNTLAADEMFRLENLNDDYTYLESEKRSESWTLDEGYAPQTPIETYPHRGSGYGVKSGLTFLLTANWYDLDYLCKGPVQGFKILLHNPAELPRLSQQYFRSPLGQEIVVAVKPKMMTTSEGLRPYEPYRRQCYFPSERYLQYFKVYTQTNCEIECLSNFTNARCGCVHFGMPHAPNVPVCNAGSMACIKKAQMELVTVEIQSGLDERDSNNSESLEKARDISARCNCLPSCTSIEYESETSQAEYDWDALYRAHRWPVPDDMKNLSYARVKIFFKEAQFITSRRSELYGLTDFLGNCGGLLGLFMGFSILSLVEILYFLTLRLCCLFKKKEEDKINMDFRKDDVNFNPKSLKDPSYID